MRRFSLLIGLVVLLLVPSVSAVGTATVTTASVGGGVTKITIAWTSATGAVSGNTFSVPRGEILQVSLMPTLTVTQPTDQYDVTLVDPNSVDLLGGLGANLSNAAGTILKGPIAWVDGTQVLDLVVANAGNSKTGTVVLLIGR